MPPSTRWRRSDNGICLSDFVESGARVFAVTEKEGVAVIFGEKKFKQYLASICKGVTSSSILTTSHYWVY